jgi:hypothetical protein
MALVHEVPAEVQEVVTEWLGKFAVAWPYHAHATMVRSGSTAIVREFGEALTAFPPGTIRNAAIDLRNTGEHFPSPSEWRRQCAQTTMRPTVTAVSSDDLPAWIRARIALQNHRNDVMLAAIGAADAPPQAQGALLRDLVACLLREWTARDEAHRALALTFTRCEVIDDETLASWARWGVAELAEQKARAAAQRAAEAAPPRARAGRSASFLRGTQDTSHPGETPT